MEFKIFVAFIAVLIIVSLFVRREKKEDLEEEKSTPVEKHFRRPPDHNITQAGTGESGSGFGFR